jgi:hypothetical protein
MTFKYDCYIAMANYTEEGCYIRDFQTVLSSKILTLLRLRINRPLRIPRIECNTPWQEMRLMIEESALFVSVATNSSEVCKWTRDEFAHWKSKNQLERLFVLKMTHSEHHAVKDAPNSFIYDFTDWQKWLRNVSGEMKILEDDSLEQSCDSVVSDMLFALSMAKQDGTFGSMISAGKENSRPRIFLSHVSADKNVVRGVYKYLKDAGFQPWLDEEDLIPGEDWRIAIEKAIRSSDVFLVFCSEQSCNKVGVFQREINHALDVVQELPEGRKFILPVRVDGCAVPDRISRWQWVNLFQSDGHKKLLNGLRILTEQQER